MICCSKFKIDYANFVGVEDKFDELEKNTEKQINGALSKLDIVSATIDEQTTQVKSLFREFDGSLVTRLDKHKFDIRLDLRNEGAQIQRALDADESIHLNNYINLIHQQV